VAGHPIGEAGLADGDRAVDERMRFVLAVEAGEDAVAALC